MTFYWCTMIQPFPTLLLCVLFIFFSTCNVFSFETNKSFYEVDEVKNKILLRDYLKKINKPAEKSIKSPDGDIIDCVLFHKQLAFDHPLWMGKITMELPKIPDRLNSTKTFQLWNANGEECPEGTVPIRRLTEEDVLRATSLKKFMRRPTPIKDEAGFGLEYAVGTIEPGKYFGGKARLNIWKPNVQEIDEYSLSQIEITSSDEASDINSIQAGWQVNPSLYKDALPRIFIRYAVSFGDRGCFDVQCPGFVQTNRRVLLGGALDKTSSVNGSQAVVSVSIQKAGIDGNWFLYMGHDLEEIGYWPRELFPVLNESAGFISFGGQIYNKETEGLHTTTQMGSGDYATSGFAQAAFVSNIEVTGPNNESIPLSGFHTFSYNPSCYDTLLGSPKERPDLDVHFFFGGPGRGPNCP